MVLLLLSLLALMIKGLISSQNLWMVFILSSYAKTLVLFPWHDLSLPLSCIAICFLSLVFLFNMLVRVFVCLFVCLFFFFFFFFFAFNKKREKSEKYKNNVSLCTLVLVYLGWHLKSTCVLCISCNLDDIFMHN